MTFKNQNLDFYFKKIEDAFELLKEL